jgi:retron-type reverse transcriptase
MAVRKSLRDSYMAALSYDKIYAAYARARKGKTNRPEILQFERHLEVQLIQILRDLQTGKYVPSKYRAFMITDPKERLILSLPFRDRVIHQWYVEEFIKPFIVPKFIHDTYACISGRGTHRAVDQVHRYMRAMRRQHGEFYIVKMDIAKFFYNIDRDVLYRMLARRIADPQVLALTRTILYSAPEEGIPIGNYTSQYFANIYLNELDQFVKHRLRIRYYVRYMDDFVCLVEAKREARRVMNQVSGFIERELKLALNRKSRYYPSRMGLDFCGYRLFFDYKLVRKRAKESLRRIIADSREDGDEEQFAVRYISWKSSAVRADTFQLRLAMMGIHLGAMERYYARLRTPKIRPRPEVWASG